jgi:hypothetical protein
VSISASYTFTLTAGRALVANFSLSGVTLRTITTSVTPAGSGTTTGAGTYADGTSVTVVATPNAGYKFSKWKDGTITVSTSPSYTFTATTNRTLVASFTVSWTITASAFPSNAGTTEMDSNSYTVGDTAQARVKTTSAGYQFLNWTENGTVVSTVTPYSFPATGNRTLVANFIPSVVVIPATGIHETENQNEMEFEWPDTADGWVLQESTNLSNWVNSTRQIQISGGKKRARVSTLTVPGVFFRLVKP